MTITLNQQEYHRNGVGGEPFRTVAFTLIEDGETTNLIAVIPSELREQNPNDGGITCYIINPANPLESKWRGDRLYIDLVEAGLWQWIAAEDEAQFEAVLAKYQRAVK